MIFDGDSITDNWQGPDQKVWQERYGSLTALDIAKGGDQVQHVLWRMQHGDLDRLDPKLIVTRDPKPGAVRDWLKYINDIISTYSSDPRVTNMDIGDKFLQTDGSLTAEIIPDFPLPSEKGYVIRADEIQPFSDLYITKNKLSPQNLRAASQPHAEAFIGHLGADSLFLIQPANWDFRKKPR